MISTTRSIKTKIGTLLLLSSIFVSCSSKTIYSQFESVSPQGWEADSVLTYSFEITDTLSRYDILLHVRHTTDYPYQNMWVFVNLQGIQKDTVEFYLADDRGAWLGNGHSIIEMPVLYEENYLFEQPGTHQIVIQHGMRTESLKGIYDIGVEVKKSQDYHGKE